MCTKTKIEGVIDTRKASVKGEVKLECAGLEVCLCVCNLVHHNGQFTLALEIREVPLKLYMWKTKFCPSWTRPRPPLAMMYYTSCSVPYPGAERGRGRGGCDIKDPPRCQMGRPPPPTTFCHINVMKTSLELERFWPSSCLGGIAMVNCPISSDSVNWWKG